MVGPTEKLHSSLYLSLGDRRYGYITPSNGIYKSQAPSNPLEPSTLPLQPLCQPSLANIPTALPQLGLHHPGWCCATRALRWLGLRHLVGLTQPLRSPYMVLAELHPPGWLCANWYSLPLCLVVSSTLDQIIPCRSLPLTALQTHFEFLSKPHLINST